MKRPLGRILLGIILIVIGTTGLAMGQAEVQRFERQLEQIRRDTVMQANQSIPADQRALIDYGAYISGQYLSLDDSNDNNHTLRQADFYAYVRANFDEASEFFLRGRATYRDYSPGDSFDGLGDRWLNPDVDRGYYRFDLQRYLATTKGESIEKNITIQAGRDIAYWGNGLTLSQVLDGIMVSSKLGAVDVDFVAGVTPTRTVDFDSTRPDFDHNTRRGFYGAVASKQIGQHRPYMYGLIQRDYNDHDLDANGLFTTRYDYNSYYIGLGAAGPLSDRMLYSVEAVFEGGNTLSNSYVVQNNSVLPVTQTRDDIVAWALDAKIDYLVGDPHNTRFDFEAIYATGDRDRRSSSTTFNGNQPGTPDHAFNGFGLLNTGLAFAPNVSNAMIFRLGASTYPAPEVPALRKFQVGMDLFLFSKADRFAPIDEPSDTRHYLGFEPDIFINWQITSDVSLAVRYGIFVPQSNMLNSDDARQFFFTGLTFAF